MKSIVIDQFHHFTTMEKEKPTAEGKWMTLKVKNCAICGSDKMFWDGLAGFDFTPGHEFSGYVEDPGCFNFTKGQRVVAAEFNSCGECEFCKEGQEQLCVQMMVDNPGVSAPGAYGEYVKVRGDYVIPMPDDMAMELGAIVEPTAVSLHGVKRLGIKPGDTVLISGNGPIGIYAAVTAKLLGAGKVVMTGRSQSRVDFCNKFDFVDICLSVKDPEYETKLKSYMPVGGFRHIVDCVGVEEYNTFINMASKGANIVILGMHAQSATFAPFPMLNNEINLLSGLYFTWADFKQSFEMIRDNQDLFRSTITSLIPQDADAIQDAFVKLFASGTNDECKIVINYED